MRIILPIAAVALIGFACFADESPVLHTIYPYRDNGEWWFDEEARGVKREPFIKGIPEMIEAMTRDIPDATKGFKLTFSAGPFEGHELQLTWLRAEDGGNWYRADALEKEGWLCGVLYKYYDAAPKQLYVRADAR